MSAPKPPPRTLDADTDRRIQRFLESAAPIVFADSALTAERWQQLSAIASEFELTADQFHATLDDLVVRGVLQRVDANLPKPPPLPRPRPVTDSRPPALPATEAPPAPSTRSVPSSELAGNPLPPRRESVFSTELTSTSADREAVETPHKLANPTLTSAGHDPSTPKQTPMLGTAPTVAGPTSRGNAKGLKDFPTRPGSGGNKSDPLDAAVSAGEKMSGRWRVEGEPAPIPARPTKKPHEIFLHFVRQSLTYMDQGVVSDAVEQRLLHHGTKVLGLSPVFARHLLDQIAAETGFHFAAAQVFSNPSSEPAVDVPDNAAYDKVRGAGGADAVNNRMELQAEKGGGAAGRLPATTTQETIETLPPWTARPSASNHDYEQLERLVPFRDYLHVSLDRAPRGLLPLSMLEKLTIAGVDLHGVDDELVLETIRHVASELKITVVTRQQAEQHVSDFVSNMLDNDVELSADQVDQVRQTGVHWGLNISQIDDIIQQVTRAKQTVRRREEITTRLALTAAAIAVLSVTCFVGYALISSRPVRGTHQPVPTAPPESTDINQDS